ncbi:beta-1,4-N-acetylgalactosaminyltransferase bre-4-like [Haliotis cracherodii]|uniref:beta-1,4-N-acetylgalactosaminyltransferase bre-4-like n=1 Tax=Haliotis cracherodii TaxID=6455 RepID=UPI0039E7D313
MLNWSGYPMWKILLLSSVSVVMLNVLLVLRVIKLTQNEGRLLTILQASQLSYKLRMSETNQSLDLSPLPGASPHKTSASTGNSSFANDGIINLCPEMPPNLVGALVVNMEPVPFQDIERQHPQIKPGGRFQPPNCKSRHHVAIIVPYRDRESHLKVLLNNLHPMLERQQLDYTIYVVEMAMPTTFNRATLMNIGYTESLKDFDFQCFIFHDVDFIAENDNNMYTCKETPRHMASAIDKHNYKLPYSTAFGGVVSLTKEHMIAVNGWSNMYFGWGSEDDDLRIRIYSKGLRVLRPSPEVGRYKMIKHQRDSTNQDNTGRGKLVNSVRQRMKTDGLNSVKYELLKKDYRKLYTYIYVRVKEEELMV